MQIDLVVRHAMQLDLFQKHHASRSGTFYELGPLVIMNIFCIHLPQDKNHYAEQPNGEDQPKCRVDTISFLHQSTWRRLDRSTICVDSSTKLFLLSQSFYCTKIMYLNLLDIFC
jgi:hypothetical protein